MTADGVLFRVLLVEDNDLDARLFEAMVAGEAGGAFHIGRCRSLADLESTTAAHPPFDAILLDLGLPDSDGIQTFDRAVRLAPNSAIIILTGNEDNGVALTAVAGGAEDYLVKGVVDGAAVVRSLTFAVERKALERRARASETTVAKRRGAVSVSQLAAGTAAELRPAIELALNNCIAAGKHFSAVQLALAAAIELHPRLGVSVEESLRLGPEALKRTLDALALVQETARSLRILGESAEAPPAWIDLHQIIRRVLLLNGERWRACARVTTRLAFEVPMVVCGVEAIERIITGLVLNAIEAFESAGRHDGLIVITTVTQPGWVWLRVSDDGPGIPDELRQNLFNAFASTKPLGKGGVGLTVAKTVIEAFGGYINIAHRQPGTEVEIALPVPL